MTSNNPKIGKKIKLIKFSKFLCIIQGKVKLKKHSNRTRLVEWNL